MVSSSREQVGIKVHTRYRPSCLRRPCAKEASQLCGNCNIALPSKINEPKTEERIVYETAHQ
jgi:hypothetical protein